jgi:tetratricopeptide (TPR) repeat protein
LTPAERDLWDFRWESAQARLVAREAKAEDAKKHLAAATALLDKGTNPEQAHFLPYLAGYVAFYNGDYKGALAAFEKAGQRDPFILSLTAQAYEKTGDQAKAMEIYRKVLTFNMHNPTNAFARPVARRKVAADELK